MTHERFSLWRLRGIGLASCLALLAACSDDDDCPPPAPPTQPAGHAQVVLRDVHGDPLPLNSTAPYSPRKTCGRCHDVDAIAGGYHFQQGRTDAMGRVDERLIRPWEAQLAVLSPGMFGKW